MQMAQPQFIKWKFVHPVTGDPEASPDAGVAGQRGGEIYGLKIRPESGTHFLLIWALLVAIVVYVATSLCSI